MKDLWHFVVKHGGYERRAGMSLGDKTIIMLNLCHALKAVPCESMLTLPHIYAVHIDTGTQTVSHLLFIHTVTNLKFSRV